MLNFDLNGKPLKRSTRDKMVFGLCGGIAQNLGVNSMLVRIAVVVMAIAIPGPSTIPVAALYAVLGLALPKDTD